MPDLQPYLTAFYRRSTGLDADPAFSDFAAAFRADASLPEQVRKIVADLTDSPVLQRDHESRMRLRTAQQMLAQFQEQTP